MAARTRPPQAEMHFLFHGSEDWKFKAKVLEATKPTEGYKEDSAASCSSGCFSNEVGPHDTFYPAIQSAIKLSES